MKFGTEQGLDCFNTSMEFGMDEYDAADAAEKFETTMVDCQHITIRLYYSMSDIHTILPNWVGMKQKQQYEKLWQLGLDTKNYQAYYEDGWHRSLNGGRQFGQYVFSQERTDKEWITKMIGGEYAASWEARLMGDPKWKDELRTL